MGIEVSAFGISLQQLLVTSRWHAKVEIALSTAELDQ
jgi:hypothetical protein